MLGFNIHKNSKVCEFVSNTTRVFRLNDEATDGEIVKKDSGQRTQGTS